MHLVNLMSIAYADGKITQDENDVLIDIAQHWGLSQEDFDDCIAYWKQTDEKDIPIAIPETDDDQVEFLKDFTLVMMIDGEIEDNEKQYLFNVADQFGYDPEKVVPQLIDIVYDEHFADGDETEDEQEEEDPLFEDTYDESQTSLGKSYLGSKEIEQAFDELFLPALRNAEAFEYFQMIPGIDTRLFRLTEKQLEKVKEVADKDYALGQYVLGRYHQVVKPEDDSYALAKQLLEKSVEGGIPDAYWALAMLYLYGYYGLVDMDTFNEYIDNAIDKGSPMALKQRIHDMIFGEHGQKAEPKKVIGLIDNYLGQNEENEAKFPFMLALLGDAYRKVGNKDKADECYEKAIDLGYFEASAARFENRVEGPDKDFYRETFSFILSFAKDEQASRCFLLSALENAYHYDIEKKEEKRQQFAEKIKADLETAYKLGEGDAAYYLGLYSYEGSHGFEQSNKEAWHWFGKGQMLESGLAFVGGARIFNDGNKPKDLPGNYAEICQLSALRRGIKEMLPAVVEAYKAGKLDDFAEEVEKNYVPLLNQKADQEAIPTVVVVTPEGKATVYKLEKAAWNKLPTLLGAKRLAPVCVKPLNDLGKKAGLTDRLTAWIDIDAPRKGLPVNKTVAKFFKGIIAGDIAFSFVDKIYEQMPFYGIDEAKTVINALGAELQEVVTDLSKVKDTKRTHADYSKVNPTVDKGFVVRIEPDGKAHIVNSGLQVFALFEEDIYDPIRLASLKELSQKQGLNGRITLWTDNSALRKHEVMESMAPENPIGAKWYPGLVASNVFVALEDENCRIMLFESQDQAKQAAIALGVKPEDVIIG